MSKNKSFIFLFLALAYVACSKEGAKNTSIYNQAAAVTKTEDLKQADVDSVNELLNSPSPNLALVNLLLRTVSPEEKPAIKILLENLSSEEAQKIIATVVEQNKGIRNNYLYHGQRYQTNKDFLGYIVKPETAIRDFSLSTQLKVSAFAYVKNKSLTNIVRAFDERASLLSKDLGIDIAVDIANSSPQLAKELEAKVKVTPQDEMIELIQKSKPFIEKLDSYFRSSNLNEKEQYVVILSGAVAGGIYELLQQNKTFVEIFKKANQIVRDVKEIEKKAKEALMLITALNEHLDNTAKDVSDFTSGVKESYRDLNSMLQRGKYPTNPQDKIDSKRIMDFLTEKVIKGKDIKADGKNDSILSQQNQINTNIYKSVNAACNIADNLSNIISTTARLGELLGVKPSKDVQKIIDGVQKVGQAAALVRSAITGWMTGGPLGAMTALSSGPLGTLLGGAGGGDSAKLGEISGKLDIIMENQRRMLQMQIETMRMIKDLALMIDQYHQEEMLALAELRDIGLTNLELEKAKLNDNISICESMIQFQLSSVWSKFDIKNESFTSINHLKLLSQAFYSRIKDKKSLLHVFTTIEGDGFAKCQNGIVQAFGGRNGVENPTRSIFMSGEENNLSKFERNLYLPQLNFLKSASGVTNLNSIPLHLPVQNMKAQEFKAAYVDHARDLESSGSQVYELEHLISTKALERYLTSLLILYPILEIDKEVWYRPLKEIVDHYLDNSTNDSGPNSRSHYFLSNALKLTQSAIAQESILAGEPMLHRLYEKSGKIFSSEDCEDIVCSARLNPLLLKNLVTFTLFSQRTLINDIFGRYDLAYKSGDVQSIIGLLRANLSPANFKVKKDGDVQEIYMFLDAKDSDNHTLRVSVKLPLPSDLQDGKIVYSENMPRLLLMQDLILENLEMVVPLDRGRGQDLLKVFLTSSMI